MIAQAATLSDCYDFSFTDDIDATITESTSGGGLSAIFSACSERQNDAIKRLSRLASLPEDWDSYGSPPPSEEIIDISAQIFQSGDYSSDLPAAKIDPISGGGIQIAWNLEERELEIDVLPNKSIEYLKVERNEPVKEGEFPFEADKIHALLVWFLHR